MILFSSNFKNLTAFYCFAIFNDWNQNVKNTKWLLIRLKCSTNIFEIQNQNTLQSRTMLNKLVANVTLVEYFLQSQKIWCKQGTKMFYKWDNSIQKHLMLNKDALEIVYSSSAKHETWPVTHICTSFTQQ